MKKADLTNALKPVTLYRMYRDQELLYIGITFNFINRFNAHRKDKEWWLEVNRIETEHFETRERALNAEQAAIRAEKPRYNVVHNKGNVEPETILNLDKIVHKEFSKRATVGQYDLNSDEVVFGSNKNNPYYFVGRLWLYPEINYSSILCDYFEDELSEDDTFDLVCDQLKRNMPDEWQRDEIPIFWSVCGQVKSHENPKRMDLCEWAPFSEDCKRMPDMPNFLTRFTWPQNYLLKDINWFSLPVINHRFPKFGQSLQWSPSPYQKTAPMKTIEAMRRISS